MDAELGGLREFYDDLMAEIHSLRGQLELCSLNSGSPGNLPQDCWEAYEMGFQKSGRYTIQPRYWGAIQVLKYQCHYYHLMENVDHDFC